MKSFEEFQQKVKSTTYEIECNSRSVINLLEAKDERVLTPRFFSET